MTDLADLAAVTATIHAQARSGNVRFTLHAHEEMIDDGIRVDQALEALQGCQVLENYAEHRRGACCLVCCLRFQLAEDVEVRLVGKDAVAEPARLLAKQAQGLKGEHELVGHRVRTADDVRHF
jgi:hypothetical protein